MAVQEQLWQVTTEKNHAAICYLKPEENDWELGGIFVVDDYRGLGVAQALCKVALSHHVVNEQHKGRIIAHVHIENPAPIKLLTRDLGFVVRPAEQVRIAAEELPDLKPDKNNMVVGDVYEFQHDKLVVFADWLEGFDGTIGGKRGEAELNFEFWAYEKNRDEVLAALRGLGRGDKVV